MKVLDTDTLTLLAIGNNNVVQRVLVETDDLGITVITRIEVLRGRFDALLKEADGSQLAAAQQRLLTSERDLSRFSILNFDTASIDVFEDLRKQKRLRKVGRADLLIAAIVIANHAALITRNLRDFQQIPGLRTENWAD